MRFEVIGVVALGLLTAACGTNTQQRAATGGLTGLGVGALVGGPIGAIVGGAVGAAGGWALPEGADTIALNAIRGERNVASGALNDVGLGPTAQAASGSSMPSNQFAKEAQTKLQQQGFYHGPIDGIVGPETKQALSQYQAHEGLQQTASLDDETLQHLGVSANQMTAQGNQRGMSGTSTPSGNAGATQAMSSDQIRQQLENDGYSDISKLRQQSSGRVYTAQASRNGETYSLRIDAHSGQVISQHRLAANQNQNQSNPSENQSNMANPNSGSTANESPSSTTPEQNSAGGGGTGAAGATAGGSTSTSTSTGATR